MGGGGWDVKILIFKVFPPSLSLKPLHGMATKMCRCGMSEVMLVVMHGVS